MIAKELSNFVDNVLNDAANWVLELTETLLTPVMQLMIGTPAPYPENWIFGTPQNMPWRGWYTDVYWKYIIPLWFGLWLLSAAYIAMVSPGIGEYKRKKLLQRLGLVFVAGFVWFPLATAGLQFFHTLAIGIAPAPTELINTFGNLIKSTFSGTIMILIVAVVENTLLAFAALVYGMRYVMLYVLTLSMPLLLVFWALEVWPISHFSNLSWSLMSYYPGLLIATLPAAILMRMAVETGLDFSMGGIAGFILAILFIPTSMVLTVLIIKNSQKAVKNTASRGAKISVKSGSYTQTRVAPAARDVHRGMRGKSPSGGGRAYNVGQRIAQSAPTDAVNNAGQAFKNTFNKVSRWF